MDGRGQRMKSGDLILMAPAIAFAGGLTGLIQHAARPGDIAYLLTSIVLLGIGVATLCGLFLLVWHNLPKDEDY
jgi:hypothetical protein